VRIPGVFSAHADILAGYLLAGATMQHLPILPILLLASSCFYCAGMALNDAFDADTDARERPGRPIPSGRIRLRSAFYLGFGLLLSGLILSRMAGFSSFIVGILLTAAIIAYDGGMKRFKWFGPITMGACRYLNLLLGLSVAPIAWPALAIPVLTGVHIFGVTALSRQETRGNDPQGIMVCAVSLVLVSIGYASLWLAGVLPDSTGLILCGLWTILLMLVLAQLLRLPSPANAQRSVKWMLLALIILDGIIVLGSCSWPWAILVWLLLIPAVAIARRFYVT
jgi:4-hydroxybenzoate polyprenyltransferase